VNGLEHPPVLCKGLCSSLVLQINSWLNHARSSESVVGSLTHLVALQGRELLHLLIHNLLLYVNDLLWVFAEDLYPADWWGGLGHPAQCLLCLSERLDQLFESYGVPL